MSISQSGKAPFEMRAVMVGPSRIGKTSLMTTLFEGGRRLLGGTKVSLEGEPPTEERLRDCRDALEGSLSGDVFNTDSLAGSSELWEYDFMVNPNITGAARFRFPLTVLDYPGGWLRPGANDADRQRIDKFVPEATTLLIPVDATVIMEAREQRHKASLASMLRISDVERVIEHWAKHRPAVGRQAIGTIALCPVKGESYFDDNGGSSDRSQDLLEKVKRLYLNRIVGILTDEQAIERASILYCPVDTIGPIKLHRVVWHNRDDGVECTPSFVKRGEAYARQTKGAEELFAVLCGEALANVRKHWQGEAAVHAAKAQAAIAPTAGATAGNKVWFYLFDQWEERWERRQSRMAKSELLSQLDEFDRAVSKIVERRRQAFELNLARGTRFAVLHGASGV